MVTTIIVPVEIMWRVMTRMPLAERSSTGPSEHVMD
jgi:hypothetical protein